MALDGHQMTILNENLSKLEIPEQEKALIMQAVSNPVALNEGAWKKLVDSVAQKAVGNMKHGRIAAKVCDYIAKSELALSPEGQEKYFRKTLLSHLQQNFKKHKSQNYKNRNSWIGFVNFLCGIFDILHINNLPLITLVVPVYEVLGILTESNFASDELAIQCLVIQLQFIGEELDRLNKQKMDELIEKLRNLLVNEMTSQLSCLMLLEIVELRSGNWKLSPSAYQYYYEESASR